MDKLYSKLVKTLYRCVDALIQYINTEGMGGQVLSTCSNLAGRTNLLFENASSGFPSDGVLAHLGCFESPGRRFLDKHKKDIQRQLSQMQTVFDALKQCQSIITEAEDDLLDILGQTAKLVVSAECPISPRMAATTATAVRVLIAQDILEKQVLLTQIKGLVLPDVPSNTTTSPCKDYAEVGAQLDAWKLVWFSLTPALGVDEECAKLKASSTDASHRAYHEMCAGQIAGISQTVWQLSNMTLREYFNKAATKDG